MQWTHRKSDPRPQVSVCSDITQFYLLWRVNQWNEKNLLSFYGRGMWALSFHTCEVQVTCSIAASSSWQWRYRQSVCSNTHPSLHGLLSRHKNYYLYPHGINLFSSVASGSDVDISGHQVHNSSNCTRTRRRTTTTVKVSFFLRPGFGWLHLNHLKRLLILLIYAQLAVTC
jgi:hypothetical protein